jgi:hypothetical protein
MSHFSHRATTGGSSIWNPGTGRTAHPASATRARSLISEPTAARPKHVEPGTGSLSLPPESARPPPSSCCRKSQSLPPPPSPRHFTPPTPRQVAKARPPSESKGGSNPPHREAAKAIAKASARRVGRRRGRMARGLRGVRDDLSELGRHLLDIACFLHPLLNPAHTDSPPPTPTGRRRRARRSPSPHPAAPPSPSLLAGILSDLAEIGGSFRGGFSRSSPAPDHPAPDALESQQAASSPSPRPPPPAAADQIADDVVGAARALAARPEAWIDFPVLALDEGNYLFSALAPTRLRLFATSANIGICLRRLRLCWWLMLPVEWFPGVGVKVAGYGSCYTC